jgi:hypothetical protein
MHCFDVFGCRPLQAIPLGPAPPQLPVAFQLGIYLAPWSLSQWRNCHTTKSQSENKRSQRDRHMRSQCENYDLVGLSCQPPFFANNDYTEKMSIILHRNARQYSYYLKFIQLCS